MKIEIKKEFESVFLEMLEAEQQYYLDYKQQQETQEDKNKFRLINQMLNEIKTQIK